MLFKSPAKRWKRRTIFLFALFFVLLSGAYTLLKVIEHNVQPVMTALAETQVRQIAADAISEALNRQVVAKQEFDGLIKFEKDNNGKVQGVIIDQYKQTKLQEDTLTRIQQYLLTEMYPRMQEEGRDKMDIYFGQMFKSKLFADKGPSLSVTIIPKGSVEVTLNPTIEAAGINMVLVNLFIDIKMKVGLVAPFPSKAVTVTASYPIATAMVVGDTPKWYWNSGDAGKGAGGNIPGLPITPALPDNSTPPGAELNDQSNDRQVDRGGNGN
ncbi:sporulation protein YunB [Numidum massiliense]|uniref:sporulation protein YunB n=1 Tax=Numidum massiliense TaxID=1522315 RepID=UPI0006D55DFD|nr:sporulation protein YunB [Numidum massiliense]